MADAEIFFLGNRHGAESALLSLQQHFSSINVLTNDPNIRSLLRTSDHAAESIAAVAERCGVMAGFTEILDQNFLANKLILNVHYSLLPQLRGLHSVAWAILNGDQKVGWTLHRAEPAIDCGDIYFQSGFAYEDETSQEIMQKFDLDVQNNLGRVVRDAFNGKISPRPQAHEKATWVPRRNREDCVIDFHSSVEHLERLFKALVRPYPLPFFCYKGVDYEIAECAFLERPYICTNGRIVNVDETGAYIKVEDGLLIAKTLIGPDGQRVAATSILKPGARLQ